MSVEPREVKFRSLFAKCLEIEMNCFISVFAWIDHINQLFILQKYISV